MKKLNSAICIILVLGVVLPAFAAEFQAKVVHITDGDTVTVVKENMRQVKIRLNGIDCPERGQANGKKATDFTKGLVALQTVTIETFGEDNHGRTLGEVTLENGRNLNQELVKHGWCWWYRKYAPGNLVLMKMEADAKEAKLGLWKDPDPIPPWGFGMVEDNGPLLLTLLPLLFIKNWLFEGISGAGNTIGLIVPITMILLPIIEFLLIRHRRRKRRDLH